MARYASGCEIAAALAWTEIHHFWMDTSEEAIKMSPRKDRPQDEEIAEVHDEVTEPPDYRVLLHKIGRAHV